ncbi:MAG: hypothetical protein HOK67_20390 [Deltaproteobacteria bacterium]|nr:hypothetical protein [Deltaproteobacteria bacterium]MBT4263523.1 hypothetical protein [Deltaproteobacteria bacterium]MBT4642386.1 hypothetical protein [Deltaproteobacteria bacterium]MBT6502251.1 hypothetical protein [Deltaproteobacteria bacterium]MBT6615254.1 hypothetical protein [Deltaproteobacteria bacterium]
MIISELHKQFKKTIPVSDAFFKLMQETFGFYTQLCNDFFANFGKHVEANTLGHFIQNEIRSRLFDQEYCKSIEKTKKQFLAENIKLEQFIEANDFKDNFINDLNALKVVSEEIYDLLQTHWEFFKYEKSVANNEVLIAFLMAIDRVGIRWDSYLEKYLAISSVLKSAGGEIQKEGFTQLLVKYHLSEDFSFSIEMAANLNQFFKEAYEFVLMVHGDAETGRELEIATLDVQNPVNCILLVPSEYFESYQKFLSYCSVDVLKRETLLKFVMEVVRLQQGKELPKTAVTNFQKKIAKPLNALPLDSFFSVEANETQDSVNILTALCHEMDSLEITYKDMLTGATDRLARNRKQALSEMTSSAINQVTVKKKVETKSEKKSEEESTVKIDIKNKEHIQFLTS